MLLVLLLTSTLAFSADGLNSRVEFWKAVFTTYGENHLIFHDRNHVHLIYDVIDLQSSGIGLDDRSAQRDAEIRQRQRIVDALSDIASKPSSEWNDYTRSLAKQVRASGVKEKPTVLADRIHIQRGVREKFSDGLKRYSELGGTVERILGEEGLPDHFAALPLVESAYQNVALSRTGAAGIWQFMPATARQYMKVTPSLDQRLDPIIATRAAARLLVSNYTVLGNWPLAISAYNHGVTGIKRAKERCGDLLPLIIECYGEPSFGYASMNFYSEFLAALELLNEHRRLLLPTVLKVNGSSVQKYRIRAGDTLIRLSKQFATTPEEIMVLNRMNDPHNLVAGRIILIPKG